MCSIRGSHHHPVRPLGDRSHATGAAWRQRSGTKAMNEGIEMTDAHFEESNIEGDDGFPATARAATLGAVSR
jgi:hypothetical protein